MKRVLVVDDDIDILEALQMTLESDGYDTKAISKGEEVYRSVDNFKPDLILLDILLSGKDGRAICKHLKNQASTKHIPIIMISAHPNAVHNIKDYGADAFIPKPFDMYDLLDRVGKYLNQSL